MLSRTLYSRAELLSAITAILCSSAALAAQETLKEGFDVLDYVDPFIGTANGGAE